MQILHQKGGNCPREWGEQAMRNNMILECRKNLHTEGGRWPWWSVNEGRLTTMKMTTPEAPKGGKVEIFEKAHEADVTPQDRRSRRLPCFA